MAMAGVALILGVAAPASAAERAAGAVYLLSNSSTANSVLVYNRSVDGALTPAGTYLTGGTGAVEPGPAPDPLGSQGSLMLAGRYLLAVNAGSNDVSMFAIKDGGLQLVDREPSGGTFPVSIAVHGGLVYVLNAGTANALPGISGFVIDPKADRLVALAHSQRPLSGGSSASGADIAFAADGAVLIVTEKGDGIIDTYRVNSAGYASQPTAFTSSGAGPFGFAVSDSGYALVSEAGAGAASSYQVGEDGSLSLVSGSVSLDGQMAPCWLVATPDGRYAYTANAGTGAISLLKVAPNGTLTLGEAEVSGVSLTAPVLDLALTGNGKFLYVRDVGNASVSGFRVDPNGALSFVGTAPVPPDDLPAQGIAAR
jgi:6-phosphogluconolactonase (cycloisomerase 2 family)